MNTFVKEVYIDGTGEKSSFRERKAYKRAEKTVQMRNLQGAFRKKADFSRTAEQAVKHKWGAHAMNPLRVAAYCRVSTDRDDQANSLASQKSYFAEYITRHKDWILKDVYYDEGISGTQTQKRTGFQSMIGDALDGEIDLILTKEVCRFARNTVDALFYTRKLKDNGVGVIFTIDNIDTRVSDGELRLTLMASIAQEESRKTSERVKWGQRRRMEQGIVFGRDMLGYTVQKGILAVNKEEVPTVHAIFQKFTNEGKSTHIIARELTEEGMPPKYADAWSNTAVLRVLRNEKYVGDLCQKKTFTPNYLTHSKKYNHGEEEMIYLKDHHEAIIDRELWNRTQAELERRSSKVGPPKKHSSCYWCSGKLYCGVCGKRLVSRTKKLCDGTIYRAWRCCDNGSVNERSLTACMNCCLRLFQPPAKELKEEILRELKDVDEDPNKHMKLRQLQSKIKSLEFKKKKAIDLMLEGTITEADLREQTLWYENQLLELKRLSAQLSLTETECSSPRKNKESYSPLTDILDEILSYGGNNVFLYRELLEEIILYKNHSVEIHLKSIPFGIRISYQTHGKKENYVTDILNVEFTDRQGFDVQLR